VDALLRSMSADLRQRWLAFYELERQEAEAAAMEADVRARAER
jgi:hypothetical protein